MIAFDFGRRAGVLFPLFSARGPKGDVATFADLPALASLFREAGLTFWQLLPLNPHSLKDDSPYGPTSSCALEAAYIDLDQLPGHASKGSDWLTDHEREMLDAHRSAVRVEFALVRKLKLAALGRAFRKLGARYDVDPRFAAFCDQEKAWLPDYALFQALSHLGHAPWKEWKPSLRDRDPKAIEKARVEHAERIAEICWGQWVAHEQWQAARAACRKIGVTLIGDLPFMCAENSSDVWALRRFFRLDASTGAPPDKFSPEAQDWHLPVPDWEAMSAENDLWNALRAERMARLYDVVRVDHALGYFRTFARPDPEPGGARGAPFFTPSAQPKQHQQGERLIQLLGEKVPLIAEAIGTVPAFILRSLAKLGAPDIKLPRWESDDGAPYDLRGFPKASVTLSGTHDTEPLASWWESLHERERALQLAQPKLDSLKGEHRHRYTAKTHAALLSLLYSSSSDVVICPLIDLLGWKDRVNIPGVVSDQNWTWRLRWKLGELERQPEIRAMIALGRRLAKQSGRAG